MMQMIIGRISIPIVSAACLVVCSCAGYQMGGHKPPSLAHVHAISVPMFANLTLQPRAESLATSAVTNALVTDGSYRLAGTTRSDAILEGTITGIRYTPVRGSRTDTLLPEELGSHVTIQWKLRDARNPLKILAEGSASGQSQYFAGSNQQTARTNSLPEAFARAANSLVSTLTNGY